jgi:hypothetical protein
MTVLLHLAGAALLIPALLGALAILVILPAAMILEATRAILAIRE